MARLEAKTLVFWAIPVGIAVVAGVLAYRAYNERPWEPPRDEPQVKLVGVCAAGRYRCRKGVVETTTGEEADGGGCVHRQVGVCARRCVTEAAGLAGIDELVAKRQLCDPPKNLTSLVTAQQSFLDQPLDGATTCDADGYQPTPDGFQQCVLRSTKDPNALGVVIGRVTCRFGAVPTIDNTPRLITREEATALWCVRDPNASDADVDDDSGDAASDADAGDAASDARDGAAPADARDGAATADAPPGG